MKIVELFKNSIAIRRWVFALILGVFTVGIGIIIIYEKLIHIQAVNAIISIIIMAMGLILIYISLINIIKIVLCLVEKKGFSNKSIREIIYNKTVLNRGPNIVVVGGGSGLSVLLRGLKKYSSNITAVVTVLDDGGSSGMLRNDMGILPPGDIRNCVLALADVEPLMEKLIQYRFKEGNMKGQNFGNLFIAALTDITNSFEQAVKEISNVLAVQGRVLPVSLEDITLNAELEDGSIIKGESNIPIQAHLKKIAIKRVFTSPDNCKPLPEVLDAIEKADCIVLGPGSLFTSIVPNLLIDQVADSIANSNAIKIYVSNIMTQPGETDGFTVSDHVKVIRQYAGQTSIEYVIVNNGEIPQDILDIYRSDDSQPVLLDDKELHNLGVKAIVQNVVDISGGLVRHNSDKLAKTIIKLIWKLKAQKR